MLHAEDRRRAGRRLLRRRLHRLQCHHQLSHDRLHQHSFQHEPTWGHDEADAVLEQHQVPQQQRPEQLEEGVEDVRRLLQPHRECLLRHCFFLRDKINPLSRLVSNGIKPDLGLYSVKKIKKTIQKGIGAGR